MAESTVRVTSRDLPGLMEILACGEPEEQTDILRALCPCRNRRYDVEVWMAILRAYECSEFTRVRDQAYHAIETLKERAKKDPRTQELMRKLLDRGEGTRLFSEAIPEWRPQGRGAEGLYIPRFEQSPRSRSNRRR